MIEHPVMTAQELREGSYENLITMVKSLLPKIPDCGKILMTKDVTDAANVFFETSMSTKELLRLSRELVPEHIVDAEIGCACPNSLKDYPGKISRGFNITAGIKEILNEIQ